MASTVDFTPLQNDEERKSNTDGSTDNTPRGNIIIWLIETYDIITPSKPFLIYLQ